MTEIRGHECSRALPVVAGLKATKIYVTIWVVVLLAAMIILQVYILQFQWWLAIVYSVSFVIAPLIYFLSRLSKAQTSADFGSLSNLSKIIMFCGILSMIFFRIYL